MPTTALDSTLEQLRLEGAIFFRAEFTDEFAFESAPLAFAAALTPHADRMILFHIVAAGSCWVAVDDGVRHWASEGDVIVMPYGDRYVLGGRTPVDAPTLLDLPQPPPWDDIPVVRQGGGGERTDVVCGYLHSEHPLFDPAMKALPPVFVVRLPDGPAASWVRASVAYAVEAAAPSNRSPTVLSTRLPELVLMEVLRAHLSTAPSSDRGWLAALRDPVLAPALSVIHGAPEHPWTVTELARRTAVSRSVLDDRFRQVLHQSPIRYLTGWRMHLAEDLLGSTDLTVYDVARRVGYRSEEAFSRAFKRERGEAPAHWRARRAHLA
ncbi:AraC family transcriptional regulator [Nocardioides pocheonensis]|uniref:AraC family transcriptional regulator n=1 Tax=Nocardioides pocheonensis TaxID=661485 RepID=A0A3N0GPK9_9ACTN|nr:AraC family transcriptional regulator [Nocardioides pocheonensis]